MRQVTRKGLVTVAAAGGMLALSGGSAFADSSAQGAAEGSPGVLSGNNAQVPVHVPVNVCGNTVNVVGLLNPAMGNKCVNKGGHGKHGGGAHAEGSSSNSPGVGSGNNVQVPIDIPVNACGNSVDVVGLLNPAMGNECSTGPSDQEHPDHPDEQPPSETPDQPESEKPDKPRGESEEDDGPERQPSAPEPQTAAQPELAQTGSGADLGLGLGLSAGLVLGGTVLYRRARAAQR
ncbi:chaplin [Streptomyces sp. JJ36]|uniref:chaplin n=1 Tax=Streptomyces sp. JJ36 TaxID=2736645 RepID=UPI001F1CDE3E|nr:chaplin family protein [Streptomyces sp. JJ36]MCF6522546.1 DUF320 domain-containing protein [Streptomyces sp. JJ36]